MKTPEQKAIERERSKLWMRERRKDPVYAAYNRAKSKEWREKNREASRAATARWQKANPKKVKAYNVASYARLGTREQASAFNKVAYRKHRRAHHLNKKFGLTHEQYEAMAVAQNHRCALCDCPDLPEKRLAVDHDHRTGKVRALLCDRCNRGIGYLDEDPVKLRAAAEYLESHNLTL